MSIKDLEAVTPYLYRPSGIVELSENISSDIIEEYEENLPGLPGV